MNYFYIEWIIFTEAVAGQGRKRATVNARVMGSIPILGNNIFIKEICTFPRSGNEAKCGVELRHSTSKDSNSTGLVEPSFLTRFCLPTVLYVYEIQVRLKNLQNINHKQYKNHKIIILYLSLITILICLYVN